MGEWIAKAFDTIGPDEGIFGNCALWRPPRWRDGVQEWMSKAFDAIGPDGLIFSHAFRDPLDRGTEWGNGWPELSIQSARTGLLSAIVHFAATSWGREWGSRWPEFLMQSVRTGLFSAIVQF